MHESDSHNEEAFFVEDETVEGVEVSEGGGDGSNEDSNSDRIYHPGPGELQLTVRAVLVGCLLGSVVASMNIYFGLKTGWSFGGSLIAAILGFATFYLAQRIWPMTPYSVLESNITQTSGSAAGSMTSTAGLLSSIPALYLLDIKLSYLEMTLWAMSVGFLGVFFAVPLRNQLVVIEKLRFPTGTATAETIVSMFAEGAKALAQARTLLFFGLFAGLFSILAFYFNYLEMPPITKWADGVVERAETESVNAVILTPAAIVAAMGAYSMKLYISPVMYGAGILIGPRVGISLLLGAIFSWGVLAPLATKQGWVTDPSKIMSYQEGARGWILWPGVAIMVADALTNLALSWRTILNTFKRKPTGAAAEMESIDEQIPISWWIPGLIAGTVLVTFTAWKVFDIAPHLTLLAVGMSSVLAMIAVRSVGETDINPTGGMGKVTQLAFGALTPGNPADNIMPAAITSAGASQAGDMMQDLKTGRMLGASPRKQMIAQCIGICAGILICVPIFWIFIQAGEKDPNMAIGSQELPAPAAMAWKAMAEVLQFGTSALPQHALAAVLGGLAFGVFIPVLRKLLGKEKGQWVPSGLAFGIAFIVPAYYSMAMFVGSMILVIWKKLSPDKAKLFAFAVASGLVAGDGLTGVIKALLVLAGLGPE